MVGSLELGSAREASGEGGKGKGRAREGDQSGHSSGQAGTYPGSAHANSNPILGPGTLGEARESWFQRRRTGPSWISGGERGGSQLLMAP